MSLNSPAVGLFTRYKHLGKMGDPDGAIVLGREALELDPPGNADRWFVLNKLALRTSIPCKQLGVVDDEAVEYDRPSLCAEGVCRSLRRIHDFLSVTRFANCCTVTSKR